MILADFFFVQKEASETIQPFHKFYIINISLRR